MATSNSTSTTTALLPDDVLLIIFSHANLDTFLTLRLLNRKIHELIKTHMNGLVHAVAASTFPNQSRILTARSLEPGAGSNACLRWLKCLRYEQLAALMLEQDPQSPVSAEDPLGDAQRNELANGWAILDNLAAIARSVLADPPANMPYVVPRDIDLRPIEGPLRLSVLIELEICRRQLVYIDGLPYVKIRAYRCFRTKLENAFTFSPERMAELREAHPHNWRPELSPWALSYAFRVGVEPFWKLACSSTSPSSTQDLRNSFNSSLDAAWGAADGYLRVLQAQGMEVLQYQVQRIISRVRGQIVPPGRRNANSTKPESPAKKYLFPPSGQAKKRQELTDSGEPAPEFVFTHNRVFEGLFGDRFARQADHQGRTPSAQIGPQPTAAQVRRRQREVVEPWIDPRAARGWPSVLPELIEVFKEWQEGWVERKGQDGLVRELLALAAAEEEGEGAGG